MRSRIRYRAPMLLLVTLAACDTSDVIDRVDDARLRTADRDSANRLTYGRTYSEQRFSPLRQVNDSTVRKLVSRGARSFRPPQRTAEPRRTAHS